MCRSLIYYKETPTQVFSCEYCEMFKNTCFKEQLRMAAPAFHPKVPPLGPIIESYHRVPPQGLTLGSHLESHQGCTWGCWVLLLRYAAISHRCLNRSRHRSCSIKKDVLGNFAKFARRHLYQSLFFNKVAETGCNFITKSCNFIKKETLVQVSCEFCEISKTSFPQNTSGRLVLDNMF